MDQSWIKTEHLGKNLYYIDIIISNKCSNNNWIILSHESDDFPTFSETPYHA